LPNSLLKLAYSSPDLRCGVKVRWLAAALLLIFVSSEVIAQVLPNTAANRRRGVAGCTQTTSGITCPGGGGGGGGSYGGYNANTMMMGIMGNAMNSFMQGYQRGLAIRARKQRGNRLNDQGLRYERQKNWSSAASSYRQALQYWNHPTIVSNLRRVEDELSGAADRRRRAERRRRAAWAAKQKRLKNMIGSLADSLTQGGTLGSLPDTDMGFAPPGGTPFFGTGGAVTANASPDGNGLSFMGPQDEFFSKGNKNSAIVDLREGASDQLAVNADKVEIGKPDDAKDALNFYQPNDKVKGAGQAGLAPGEPIPVKRTPTSRKAELLLDSLEHGNRDWHKSREYLVKLVEANPNDQDALAALQDLDAAQALDRERSRKTQPLQRKEDTHELMNRLLVKRALEDKGNYDKFGWSVKPPTKEQAADPQYQHKMLTAEGLRSDKQGHHRRARHYFERALALDPKNEDVKAALENTQKNLNAEADKLMSQGLQARKDGDALKELSFYDKALVRKPNDPAIKNLITEARESLRHEAGQLSIEGVKKYQAGDPWRALVYFRQAQERMPSDKRLKAVIKVTEDTIKNRQSGQGPLRNQGLKDIAALTRKKLDDEAHDLSVKGIEAGRRGDELKSLDYFKQALKRRPNDQGIKDIIAHSQKKLDDQAHTLSVKGIEAGRRGNEIQALGYFKQALKRRPNDQGIKDIIAHSQKKLDDQAHALSVKGIEAGRRGNEKQALEYFKQALKRRPNDQGIKDIIKHAESKLAKKNNANTKQ